MDQDKEPLLKKFKQSKLAEFIREKVKPVVGDVLEVVGDITGRDSVERLGQFLNDRKEDNEQVKALYYEFEKYKMEWQLELESIRMQHGLEVMRVETEQMKIAIDDKDSARAMYVDHMRLNGGKKDIVQIALSLFILAITAYMIIFLSFWQVPEKNERLFDLILGGLVISSFGTLREFYLGTSFSSRKKDETIHKLSDDKA